LLLISVYLLASTDSIDEFWFPNPKSLTRGLVM